MLKFSFFSSSHSLFLSFFTHTHTHIALPLAIQFPHFPPLLSLLSFLLCHLQPTHICLEKVDDVETKLDNLIELYMQDRKRLLSLPICPDSSHSNNLPPQLPPPSGGGSSIVTSNNTTVNSSANGASSSGSLKVIKMVI